MLTATEAAQALGVSKRHLYQLAAAKLSDAVSTIGKKRA